MHPFPSYSTQTLFLLLEGKAIVGLTQVSLTRKPNCGDTSPRPTLCCRAASHLTAGTRHNRQKPHGDDSAPREALKAANAAVIIRTRRANG